MTTSRRYFSEIPMKALSVRQPWASLIAEGKKSIELRTRKTHYRGPLLICASRHKQGDGPKGVALAVVDVVDCRPAVPGDEKRACCKPQKDHYAWCFAYPRPVDPFPVRGNCSLFHVDYDAPVYSNETTARPREPR